MYETDGPMHRPPDLLIVSYANGLRLSLQAQRRLAEEHGVRARVLDLRWLNPLPSEALRQHAAEAGAVLVVDECRRTGGGVADAIIADLAEAGARRRVAWPRSAPSTASCRSARRPPPCWSAWTRSLDAALAAVGERSVAG